MKMLIGGLLRSASDNKTIEVLNPATGAVIDTIPAATEADVREAIALSIEGQKKWAAYPLYKRAEIIRKFVDLTEARVGELGLLQSLEMGKPLKESIGDFVNIRNIFCGFIEAADNLLGSTMPIGVQMGKENDFEMNVREPLGTVVCIIPFNGPLVLFSHKVAPALIAGNSVIVKPASDDPLTILRLGELLLEAGVPGGAAQFVTGSGAKVGRWLTEDPRIAKVSFTGSTEVGLEIAKKRGRESRQMQP